MPATDTIFDYSTLRMLNQTIAELYNDELPLSTRLLTFLNNIVSFVYYDKATILFFYKDEDGVYHKHSSISMNWEDKADIVKTYDDYYCQHDDTLPIFDMDRPIVFRSSTFFDPKERKNNEYWRDYLIPTNCIYSLEGNLQLKNSENLRGAFNFYRGKEKADFTEWDVQVISLLQPHLSSILKHYGTNSDSAQMMFALENYSCVGVAAFDANCQVIRSNSTYKKLESSEKYGNVIAPKAISLCLELSSSKSQNGNGTIEYKFSDFPIFMEVSKTSDSLSDSKVRYMVMVYDLSHFVKETLNTTKDQYTLSPREFEILQKVLKGKSNEQIASEMYVSVPTVKKHLASIYGKMDIKNQKQIFEKLNLD